MMAYVTVEDDTASIEMLAFSNVLSQYGSYLKENQPVVVTGRLSIRDEKEPQIVVNRARPISDYANETPQPQLELPKQQKLEGTLYLRLPSQDRKLFPKVKAILNMFPGEGSTVVYFADTGKRLGKRCAIMENMVTELKNLLGEGNVVLK